MYILYVILEKNTDGTSKFKWELGRFHGSPFWTDCWNLAKKKYGEDNIEYEWESGLAAP